MCPMFPSAGLLATSISEGASLCCIIQGEAGQVSLQCKIDLNIVTLMILQLVDV